MAAVAGQQPPVTAGRQHSEDREEPPHGDARRLERRQLAPASPLLAHPTPVIPRTQARRGAGGTHTLTHPTWLCATTMYASSSSYMPRAAAYLRGRQGRAGLGWSRAGLVRARQGWAGPAGTQGATGRVLGSSRGSVWCGDHARNMLGTGGPPWHSQRVVQGGEGQVLEAVLGRGGARGPPPLRGRVAGGGWAAWSSTAGAPPARRGAPCTATTAWRLHAAACSRGAHSAQTATGSRHGLPAAPPPWPA